MKLKNPSKNAPNAATSLALFKRSLSYFAPFKPQAAVAIAAMIVVALCNGYTAYLVKPAFDDIFGKLDREALFWVPLAFVGVTLAKVLCRTVQNYTMQYCGLKVLERLRDELCNKILRLPMRFYEGTQVGMLMSRVINDVVMIRSSLPAMIMLVRQIITMASLIVVIFYQDPYLASWAMLALPFAGFPFIYFGRRHRKLGRKGQMKVADISILLQEVFSGIRVVKAFATELLESRRFDKENRRLLKISLNQCLASEMSSSAMEFIGAVGMAAVMWYGGLRVIEGQSTPGTFFSFVAAVVMLYDPLKKLSDSNQDIQKALAGAERVFEIIDSREIVEESGGPLEVEGAFRELSFEDVSFSYNPDAQALAGINLTVKAGERVAIVGPSGAGKSTFVNLIPRFYDPDSGVIKLNGRPLREYDLASLRRNVAIVSQDNFLFNVSIRENIGYGLPELSEEACAAAAEAAYVDEFIRNMPENYDTLVGERGTKLSGGQKQRITIARAIAKDASLLILDEATSALDSESEKIVQKALENLMRGRTSIVIAHRLSTILNSDRILVMDRGRVIAQGPHSELLNASPLYAKLYSMQFGLSEER